MDKQKNKDNMYLLDRLVELAHNTSDLSTSTELIELKKETLNLIRFNEYNNIIDALKDDVQKLSTYGMEHKTGGILRSMVIIQDLYKEGKETW